MQVFLPYKEGRLISLFHEQGQIEMIEHLDGGVKITGKIPGRIVSQFASSKHQFCGSNHGVNGEGKRLTKQLIEYLNSSLLEKDYCP